MIPKGRVLEKIGLLQQVVENGFDAGQSPQCPDQTVDRKMASHARPEAPRPAPPLRPQAKKTLRVSGSPDSNVENVASGDAHQKAPPTLWQ
ncbi:hypothetical protein D3C84_1169950 [compost metagenome]